MKLTLLALSSLLCWHWALAIDAGLSADFRQWLTERNISAEAMARDDIAGGSFGGRAFAAETVTRQPVIFVHGNSDRALGGYFGGWTSQVEHFTNMGYRACELYATTWGPANVLLAPFQTHSQAYVSHVRQFIQAVLQYTGAEKVDVVTHSMGVTLTRKAIKGGLIEGVNLGPPLTDSVDTFVGIAGGNYGLSSCFMASITPTCSRYTGFFPGYYNPFLLSVYGRSKYLNELLEDEDYEGAHRYALWSTADDVIKYGCLVYGKVTCHFPGMTGDKKLVGLTHKQLKDNTGGVVHSMVTDHVIL